MKTPSGNSGEKRSTVSSPREIPPVDEILAELRQLAQPRNLEGMRRFGIQARQILGVSIPELRALAKRLGRDHALAESLWQAGIHESRILASLVDEPAKVTRSQMDRWIKDLENWADCDAVCGNLFDRTPHAVDKATEWINRKEEFQKRAGFVLMATLAVHDKTASDEVFLQFLPLLKAGAADERNFVRKAVNWALRQIGKRNAALSQAATRMACEIHAMGTPAARWIANDALREFERRAGKINVVKVSKTRPDG
ncbi:MAG TPA: DNA alkylation repair protein [Candidatus Limnocylindria bacterium]|nr:DNA alkylation repair protein [Candidatus Limnocylindria bacterium]